MFWLPTDYWAVEDIPTPSYPPPFLSLPPELVWEISQELEPSEQRALRSTCKQLSAVMTSITMRSIVLDINSYNLHGQIALLHRLASSEELKESTEAIADIAPSVRELHIHSLAPSAIPSTKTQRPGPHGPPQCERGLREASAAEIFAAQEQVEMYISQAIGSLANVETISWTPHSDETERVHQLVFDAISGLPNLKTVHFTITNLKCAPPVDSFPPLHNISISGWNANRELWDSISCLVTKSSDLTSLVVDGSFYLAPMPGAGKPSTGTVTAAQREQLVNTRLAELLSRQIYQLSAPGDLFALDGVCLQRLTSLTLIGTNDPFSAGKLGLTYLTRPGFMNNVTRVERRSSSDSDTTIQSPCQSLSSKPDIWQTFLEHGIHLEEITTDLITPSLMTYLESYSGLRKINLRVRRLAKQNGPPGSGCLAYEASRFFNHALDRHTATLTHLDIDPVMEGPWCFDLSRVDALKRCTRLESLAMSFVASHVDYATLSHRDMQDGSGMNIINAYIDMAAVHLPQLATLGVRIASNHEHQMTRSYSGAITSHFLYSYNLVHQLVQQYAAPQHCHRLPSLSIGTDHSYVGTRVPQKQGGLWKNLITRRFSANEPLKIVYKSVAAVS